eukprot:637729-Pyramimonas_sp.AAC.1
MAAAGAAAAVAARGQARWHPLVEGGAWAEAVEPATTAVGQRFPRLVERVANHPRLPLPAAETSSSTRRCSRCCNFGLVKETRFCACPLAGDWPYLVDELL